MTGWIGVDLDGTLAHFDKWRGPESIGLPIPSMVKRVESWVAEGREVRIFTARASDPRLIPPVKRWLKLHGLPDLPVTNLKDFQMIELWDDRAVQVIHNTGRAVQPNTLDKNHKPELIDPDALDAAPEASGLSEQEMEPTAEEVEAFRKAVKERSSRLDDNLLDALDAGEEYRPSEPIAPVVDAIAAVVFTSGEPADAPSPTAPVAERHFPTTSENLDRTAILRPEVVTNPSDADISLPGPDIPFEPLHPLPTPTLGSRPAAAKGQLPALNFDDDEPDDGVPSLRVEQH